MKKEKYYLNKRIFEEELSRHEGEKHPSERYGGHYARLDKQCEVASIIHTSNSTISNGFTKGIALHHLIALGELFGCDWRYLCGLSPYRTKEEEAAARKQKYEQSVNEIVDTINSTHAITKSFLSVLGYEIEEAEDRVEIRKTGYSNNLSIINEHGELIREKNEDARNWSLSKEAFESFCVTFRASIANIADNLFSLEEKISFDTDRIEKLETQILSSQISNPRKN